MNDTSKIIAIIVAVFFIGYFLEEAIDATYSHNDELKGLIEHNIELLSELASVFASFSIFAISWHAYGKSRDNHSLFLGATFLVVGILSLFHLLSYPFMPDFITPNSSHKSDVFLVESRLILSICFLVSAYIYTETLPKVINRSVLLASAIVVSAISMVLGLFYHTSIFAAYDPDTGYTSSVIYLFYITAILYASYLYAKRLKETGQKNLHLLIYGFIIIISSILVYFSYELSGHFLIITGFYFVYLALYKSSVELPYEKLAIAEEKLRHAAEEKYKNLFDNANDAIVIFDLEDNITAWNRGAANIFGWTAQEAIGKKLVQLIQPSNLLGLDKIVNEVLTDRAVSGVDISVPRKNGTMVDVSLTISPIKGTNQNIISLSGIFRDNTERKKVDEIRLENERLVLANKAKSEFLTVMSHELRTPLNSVIGFSEILKQKTAGELNAKQEHFVDNVIRSGKNLLTLINDILDITRIESGKMDFVIEDIPVSDLINEALDSIKAKAAKQNIVLKKEFDPQLEFIKADRRKINQILFNLLSNAVKFSKKEDGTVTITTKKEGDMARFSVSDTGIGIKEEDMGRLFKDFEQLDSGISRSYGGTGLGLAITKKLVELHGGEVTVESRYGVGSTFTFALPIPAKKQEGT